MSDIYPKIRISADTRTQQCDVFIDPRFMMSDTARKLVLKDGKLLERCPIAHNDLYDVASRLSERIMDLVHKREVEIQDFESMNPLWKHDCDECVYLGTIGRLHEEKDLYFCSRDPRHTLIARYGSDGSQYVSGLPLVPYERDIWNAGVLAEARGLGTFVGSKHMIVIDGEVTSALDV